MFLSNERLSGFLHIATAAPFILGVFAVAAHLVAVIV